DRSEMERGRLPPEPVLGHRGEEMLTGVLLHMIEAARPVEREARGPDRNRRGKVVTDLAVLLLHVEDGDVVQEPVIRGLAAAFGIEDRVGEDGERTRAFGAREEHVRLERRPPRLALVRGKFGGHFRPRSYRSS